MEKTATQHRYIERNPAICDGKAVITGTRIKVTQVATEYERLGWTPDQIIEAHPHLTLAQIHDALSYYYENQAELDAEIIAGEQLVSELRDQYPSRISPVRGH
ncbi:MAG: DUF433 domain-containing protein [Chloroflexi bacterium]|nr:DUF433 domain-containing protein [Chloroflexota bacterium]MCI0575414.1 DUF433 domain-containing protein [Chloroflexota bacterium]MCI0649853.1 DUF433 domain-containing protein [Chloroflexota bacterium]MCI0730079.1 DUF433 domain-containing protein [Chloroflexota bacterium]